MGQIHDNMLTSRITALEKEFLEDGARLALTPADERDIRIALKGARAN